MSDAARFAYCCLAFLNQLSLLASAQSVTMANRVRRWRGPRRPDVQELKDYSFAGQAESAGAPAAAPQIASHLRMNPGVRHFKYGFLSAGLQTAEQAQAGLRVNVRSSIMDALRTFEEPKPDATAAQTVADKQARALANSATYNYPAGLGYGSNHPNFGPYLSKDQPPRATESFAERPLAFPTVDMPPVPAKPGDGNLSALPYDQQDAYSATLKKKIASGLGYGYTSTGSSSGSHGHAYIANSYWRRHE